MTEDMKRKKDEIHQLGMELLRERACIALGWKRAGKSDPGMAHWWLPANRVTDHETAGNLRSELPPLDMNLAGALHDLVVELELYDRMMAYVPSMGSVLRGYARLRMMVEAAVLTLEEETERRRNRVTQHRVNVAMAGVEFLLQVHRGWWAVITDPEMKEGDEVAFYCGGRKIESGKVVEIIPPGRAKQSMSSTFGDWWKIVYKAI